MNASDLQKLAKLLALLKVKVKCPICLDHVENSVELECTHCFCNKCFVLLKAELTECPLCKTKLRKRASIYKDQFADELSKFVNRSCQLVKEQYACEVEELCFKDNLQEIIAIAPADAIPSLVPESKNENAFDKLLPKPRRTYANRKKLSNNAAEKIKDFTDEDTRKKIIDWLNANQDKLDVVTQSPQFLSEDEAEFQMPSISQVPAAQDKRSKNRKRTQSLNVDQKIEHPAKRKNQSLAGYFDDGENYNIEEVHSEALVQQVERRVIQDLLEDECLENLDQVAKLCKEKPKVTPKRKSKAERAADNVSNSESSGWNRIEDVKKSIKRATREPKQLNISEKKSPGRNCKKSPREIVKSKTSKDGKSSKTKTPVKNTNQLPKTHHSKPVAESNANAETTSKAFNLSSVEKYFQKHMDKVKASPGKNSSSDGEIDIIEVIISSKESKDNAERISTIKNQITSQNILCPIPPIPVGLNNLDNIAVRLTDNLKSCLSNVTNLQTNIGKELTECFTNLLTYAEKIVQVSSCVSSRKHAGTQTRVVKYASSSVQTSMKKLLEKCVQTDQKIANVQVQTDAMLRFEQQTQVSAGEIDLLTKEQTMSLEYSHRKNSIDNKSDGGMVASKAHPKKSRFPIDASKETKSNESLRSSVLVCSVDTPGANGRKSNRKLTYEQPQNRTFKRIREPAIDSDSDEDSGASRKRQLHNDDFSVEFISERLEHESQTSESENIDYDEYLLEVMNRDDSSPPKKKPRTITQTSQINGAISQQKTKGQNDVEPSQGGFTAALVRQENLDKFDREIMEFEQNSKVLSTEFDLVENTPVNAPSAPKIPKLSNTKKGLILPIEIISKGSIGKNHQDDSNQIHSRNDSVLNRAVDKLPSQTEKCTDDLAVMLEDLKNDPDFFKSNTEDGEKEENSCPGKVDNRRGKVVEETEGGDKNDDNRKSMDESMRNVMSFDEDDLIEQQMQKISFTAVERYADENRINILQNITLKTPAKKALVTGSSDDSDEEIVETTPQKKKNTSHDCSLSDHFDDDEVLDVCLPPPPGFGDEVTPLIDEEAEGKENCPPQPAENPSSLTPDRLTNFIVTPDEKFTEKEESQHQSMSFKSFVTPNRAARENARTQSVTRIVDETENIFSPIAKCSIKMSQVKYTPLVSASRPQTKKPGLMTSTPNQKSILNYVVPSQESLSQKAKPCIMWSRIIGKDLNVFTQLECKKLLTTAKTFSAQVTHLIVLVDEKGQLISHTAKILQAIAAGIWVVRYEWAEDCLRMKRIVPEDPYEALDTSGVSGPKISRLSRGVKPLFQNFKFYCAEPLKTVPKSDLESILSLSGGEIANDLGAFLNDDGKVHIIIVESSASQDIEQFDAWLEKYKAATIDVEWLTSCIGQYKLVSFRPFIVSGDESVICDLGYPSTLVESVPFTVTEGM